MNIISHQFSRVLEEVHEEHVEDSTFISEDHVWGVGIAVSIGYLIFSFLLTLTIVCCYRSKKMNKAKMAFITTALISLAVGSLMGDAVVHLLPAAYGVHGHGGEEEHHEEEIAHEHAEEIEEEHHEEPHVEEDKPNINISSLLILVGFFTFFSLDKLFNIAGCGHSHGAAENEDDHSHDSKNEKGEHHGHNHEGHDHKDHKCEDHSHQAEQKKQAGDVEIVNLNSQGNKEINGNNEAEEVNYIQVVVDSPESPQQAEVNYKSDINEAKDKQIELKKNENSNRQETSDSIVNPTNEGFFDLKNKKPAGYLILISGCIHNIMDGIGMGIAFSSRKVTLIIATNIAILLHEIPKELGDAGILLSSNFKPASVLFWNVSNNITSVIGTLIGLGIGEISEAAKAYSLGFVAGNFFYIALAEMIPEIMKKKGVWMHIIQFALMIIGIGIMYLIVLYESSTDAH